MTNRGNLDLFRKLRGCYDILSYLSPVSSYILEVISVFRVGDKFNVKYLYSKDDTNLFNFLPEFQPISALSCIIMV